MKYGYARVSTVGQNLQSQIDQLREENCDLIFKEKYTGTTISRPIFENLLNELMPNDILVVTKLDRFARNTKEALNVIQDLFDKNIKVHILNMGMIENTPTGKLIFTILSAFAQFERDMIVTRTQEGKELAKRMNPSYHEGRNFKYSDEEIQKAYSYFLSGLRLKDIKEITGISIPTLSRRFKKLK